MLIIRGIAILLVQVLWAMCVLPALGGEPVEDLSRLSVADRFSVSTSEVPSLRRHVVPLLGRLGCSAASCHGAKDGQAGFQLSLFGFDFQADLTELADEGDVPRANWKEPTNSLLLHKPTLLQDHFGGKHFEPESWQYRLLFNWINARAPGLTPAQQQVTITRLAIEQESLFLFRQNEAHDLKVVAHWSDGAAEDVTPLCRFQSNDPSVVEVASDGTVKRVNAGDTHVIAFYDRAIASTPVYAPRGPTSSAPAEMVDESVDGYIDHKLALVGIQPSEACSDAEFLRRASLDATGTLPTVDEVEQFINRDNPTNRNNKIEQLLASDQYAVWWSTWLCELTGNAESVMPEAHFRQEQSRQWYDWIHTRVSENTPYDQIVNGLVAANSRYGAESYHEYSERMTSYVRSERPDDFSSHDSMPHFWARRNVRSANDKALAFSYVFLGVQLQCAECHKHPFDRWTKDDFDGLRRFFEPLRYGRRPDSIADYRQLLASINVPKGIRQESHFVVLARQGHTVPWGELYYDDKALSASGSQSPAAGNVDVAPREILMQWIRGLDHPYLAVAFVNRVWHHYFGVGIVDPPDDISLANPPSNLALLDYLTAGFVQSGYDMKWLHREILSSRAYQRSWRPNESNEADARNFSRAQLRRLPAEVMLDAIYVSTAADQQRAIHSQDRAIGAAAGLTRSDSRNRILQPLGKPNREAVCTRERKDEPNLSQTLFLQNDPLVHDMLSRSDGWLASIANEATDAHDEKLDRYIQLAFVRTLSRVPTERELEQCRRFASASRNTTEGMRGILWALLNSKEFCLN